jgi:hypothetical protein
MLVRDVLPISGTFIYIIKYSTELYNCNIHALNQDILNLKSTTHWTFLFKL